MHKSYGKDTIIEERNTTTHKLIQLHAMVSKEDAKIFKHDPALDEEELKRLIAEDWERAEPTLSHFPSSWSKACPRVLKQVEEDKEKK